MNDIMYDEKFVMKENKTSAFRAMMNRIMDTEPCEGVKQILDALPKFKIPRMSMEEIDAALKRITRSVVFKLYQSDVGEYSLRGVLDEIVSNPMMNSVAASNIAYGVLSSASPYMLASLFYFFDKSFIFFYIRDTIVEPNYREYVEEIKSSYNKPSSVDEQIRHAREFEESVNKLLYNMCVRHNDIGTDTMNKIIQDIRQLVAQLPDHIVASILKDGDWKYPLPRFLYRLLTSPEEAWSAEAVQFLKKIRVTFTVSGLKSIFNDAVETPIGSVYEKQILDLNREKCNVYGIDTPIDGLSIEENLVMKKLLSFSTLTEDNMSYVNNSAILKRVHSILGKYPSIDTKITISNEKMVIKYKNETAEYFFQSDKVEEDLSDPFIIFGPKRVSMKNIYTHEPNKFFANQTVLTTKERQNMFLSGKDINSMTLDEKLAHRSMALKRLMSHSKIKNKPELIDTIHRLSSGGLKEITYSRLAWFTPQINDDPVKSALVIAELIGISKTLGIVRK